MIKKICLIIIILFMHNVTSFSKEKSIRVKYKVNNEFITSYDIIKETKYLIALNRELEKIDKNQLNDYAESSLLKEKIKKHEIEKYYEVDYKTDTINKYLDDFMVKLNIEDISSFENYLISYETNLKEVRKKLVIEQTWNQMIFDLYNHKIIIDEKEISETLEKLIEEKKRENSYELFEIFFSAKNKESLEEKYNEVISSIDSFGFEKAAVLHSMSNTSEQGGRVGWINQNRLSKEIFESIKDLSLGSYSKPIIRTGGLLILFVKDKKEISSENIDKDLELSKIISSERNRQLNEFSIIHFKKTENKSYVKKF